MKRILVAGWATGVWWISSVAAEVPLWQQPDYVDAILKARAGDPGTALGILERQREQGALPMPLLDDYLVLLIWSGHGADALRGLPGHEADVSVETLGRLARAARDLRDSAEAVRLYQWLVSRQPNLFAPRLGLAMAQAEAGQRAAAVATLSAAQPANQTEELEWLRARAYVALQADDVFFALNLLTRARERFAADAELDRLYLSCLLRLGVPDVARQAADGMEHVDTALDLQIDADRAAVRSRWGRIRESLFDNPERYQETDQALAMNAEWAERARSVSPRFALLADDDRLQMLQQRGLAAAVVVLGQQRADGQWSPYARAALADAYLTLKQPQRAVALYRSALQELPVNRWPLDWREGLVYALLEAGDYEACRTELAALLADTPRTIVDAAGRIRFNRQFQRVTLLDTMMTAYMDDPRSAWQALEAQRSEAPANAALRQSQGALAAIRGWPRRARDIYRRLLVDDPDAIDPHGGLASVALDLHEPEEAQRQLGYLQQWDPQANVTRQLDTRMRTASRPQLVIDVGRDSGDDQGSGSQHTWDTGARLYSASWGHWRLFGLQTSQQAQYTTQTGTARFQQHGMGAQYRSEQGTAEWGLTGQVEGQSRAGAFIGYDWTHDDHWTVATRLDSNSADVPLKGRLTGTWARAMQLALTYRVDESRSFGARATLLSMSDGNRRRSWSANWDERWVSGPRYQFSTQAGLSGSANDDVPTAWYFNPRRDAAWWLSGMNEWPIAGHYENRWSLRAGATVGSYWQQGCGSAPVRVVVLEAVWRGSQGTELRAGWGRTRHPYDGVPDTSDKVYLHWERRF